MTVIIIICYCYLQYLNAGYLQLKHLIHTVFLGYILLQLF